MSDWLPIIIAYGMVTLVLFAVFAGRAYEEKSRTFAGLSLVTPLWPVAAALVVAALPFLFLWVLGKMVYWAFGGRRD